MSLMVMKALRISTERGRKSEYIVKSKFILQVSYILAIIYKNYISNIRY